MMRYSPFFSAAALVSLTGTCSAQLLFWDGECNSGLWLQACSGGRTNWSPNQIPTASDDVVIDEARVVVQAGTAEVRSILQTGSENLEIATNGTLVIGGQSLIARLGIGGIVVANAPVELSGEGGNGKWLVGTGPVVNRGDFTLYNQSLIGSEMVFENRGTLRARGGDIATGGQILNLAGGTMLMESNGSLGAVTGRGGLLVNDGGEMIVDGASIGMQTAVRQERGKLTVKNLGSWTLEGLVLQGGAVEITDESTMRQRGDVVIEGVTSVTGDGSFHFDLGSFGQEVIRGMVTFDLDPTVSVSPGLLLNTDGITFDGGELINDGRMRWTRGIASGPGTIRNKGECAVATGQVNATSLTNEASGTILIGDLSADDALFLRDDSVLQNFGRVEVAPPPPGTPSPNQNRREINLDDDAQFVNEDGATLKLTRGLVRRNQGAPKLVNNGVIECGDEGELSITTIAAAVETSSGLVRIDRWARLELLSEFHVLGGTASISPRNLETYAQVWFGGDSSILIDPGAGLFMGPPELHAMVGSPQFAITGGGAMTASCFLDLQGLVSLGGGFATAGVTYVVGPLTIGGVFTNRESRFLIQSDRQDGRYDISLLSGARIENEGEWGAWNIGDATNAIFVNSGRLATRTRLNTNDQVNIEVCFDNQGEVEVLDNLAGTSASGTRLRFREVKQIAGGVLAGGTWIVQPRSELIFEEFVETVAEGTVIRGASNATLPSVNAIATVFGNVFINGETHFNRELLVYGGGRVVSEGARVEVPQGLTNGEPGLAGELAQTVVGNDSDPVFATPLLLSRGTLLPGDRGGAGPFNVEGNITLAGESVCEVELGGLTPEDDHDVFDITGAGVLGGTLRISLLPGFEPARGDQYHIMTMGSRAGEFDDMETPMLSGGLSWQIDYGATSVILRVVGRCYPDCSTGTGAGVLDIFDFICFQDAFVSGDPYADCTGEGAFDIFDFICFQDAFALGCQ